MTEKIVLTPEQIKSLHKFVQEEGQPSYTIGVGKSLMVMMLFMKACWPIRAQPNMASCN